MPVDASEARKKVAQALQYQRRKNAKLDNIFHRQGNEHGDFVNAPPPPDLRRQEQFNPNKSNLPDLVMSRSNKKKNVTGNRKHQDVQAELVRSCVDALAKSREESKRNKVQSSLFNTSVVQATAIANIATCGRPVYSSNSNSLNHLIANSRKNVVKINTKRSSSSMSTPEIHGGMKQQHQEVDSPQLPLMSCATSSMYLDTTADFFLPEMDVALCNDNFEQDESYY